jgi:branched-chain amino acid aminotransferase
VFLNGRFVPEREAKVSIFDSALVLGDMAFESTRTFRGEPFELAKHLDRLFGTLEILQIDCGLKPSELDAITRETLERNRKTEPSGVEWQIIHNISSGPVDLYRAAFPEPLTPTVSINCWPLIPQLARIAPLYEMGARLVIPEQRVLPPGFISPRAKTRSRVHARLAQIQAHAIEPHSWPLLLDEEGYLAEGPSWNIFLIQNGKLLTPSERNVLPGVSRTITISLAQELGIAVEEKDIIPGMAQAAEEMFCTATSFCVVPVRTLNGTSLGTICPGPVTRQLMDAWQTHVGVDFVAQAQWCAGIYPEWLERERKHAE